MLKPVALLLAALTIAPAARAADTDLATLQRQLDALRASAERLATTRNAPAQASAGEAVKMAPGLEWEVRPMGQQGPSLDAIGTFASSSFPLSLSDHRRSVETTGNVAYAGSGYLVVRQPGPHTFLLRVDHPGFRGEALAPNCVAELSIAGTRLARVAATARSSSLDPLSAEALASFDAPEAGAYEVAVTFGCAFRTGGALSTAAAQTIIDRDASTTLTIKLKTPADTALRDPGGTFIRPVK